MLKQLQFANGIFIVQDLIIDFDVVTSKELYDGDPKSKLPILPPDKYEVFDIVNNCYGTWIRIAYKGRCYSIAPNDCIYARRRNN